MHNYLISNIYVQSDFKIIGAKTADILGDIRNSATINSFPLTDANAPKQTVSDGAFSFSTVEGLLFSVSDGNRISVFKKDHVQQTDVQLFLLGSAWGALCHQRGLLPLHCSGVSIGNDAFVFVADSGGGKSTIAASLCNDDVRHVCDDVAIANVEGDGAVNVYAMPKGLKLWQDSRERLDLRKQRLATAENGREKYYVDPPEGPEEQILSLKGIFELCFSVDDAPTRIERLNGVEALKVVYRNIYRVEWLDLLGVTERVLKQSRDIAANVPVFRFTRPRSLDRLAETSSALKEKLISMQQAVS